MTASLSETLWALATEARTLETIPVTDNQLVDTVGTIRGIETRLAAIRRSLQSEITGPQEGSDYRAVSSRKAKRSYNTNGILAQFSVRDVTDANAAELKWRWTDLKRLFERNDLALPTAYHEIEDGDPAYLVGEVWTDDIRVEAIPADEQTEVGF